MNIENKNDLFDIAFAYIFAKFSSPAPILLPTITDAALAKPTNATS